MPNMLENQPLVPRFAPTRGQSNEPRLYDALRGQIMEAQQRQQFSMGNAPQQFSMGNAPQQFSMGNAPQQYSIENAPQQFSMGNAQEMFASTNNPPTAAQLFQGSTMPYQQYLQNVANANGLPMEQLRDFTNYYNTPLTPQEEQQFQQWAAQRGGTGDLYDYDMRGFWKGGYQTAENGHGTDLFKKPNHPTFSDQSMYAGRDGWLPGRWQDQTFTRGKTNVYDLPWLQNYFREVEPGVTLIAE